MGNLSGFDELCIVMGAAGQQLQDIFCTNDGKQVGLWIAIDCRQEKMAAWFQQVFASADDRAWIRHMLEHLKAGDDVKLFYA